MLQNDAPFTLQCSHCVFIIPITHSRFSIIISYDFQICTQDFKNTAWFSIQRTVLLICYNLFYKYWTKIWNDPKRHSWLRVTVMPNDSEYTMLINTVWLYTCLACVTSVYSSSNDSLRWFQSNFWICFIIYFLMFYNFTIVQKFRQ